MTSLRLRVLLPVLAALSLGCSGLSIIPPDVALVNVAFEDMSLFETTGTITVRVSNENREPLVVDGASFKLILDGVTVGKALSDHRYSIPRLASATDEVTIYLSNIALATRLRPVLKSERVSWRLQAKVWLVGPLGTRRLTIKREGVLDLKAAGTPEPSPLPALPDPNG